MNEIIGGLFAFSSAIHDNEYIALPFTTISLGHLTVCYNWTGFLNQYLIEPRSSICCCCCCWFEENFANHELFLVYLLHIYWMSLILNAIYIIVIKTWNIFLTRHACAVWHDSNVTLKIRRQSSRLLQLLLLVNSMCGMCVCVCSRKFLIVEFEASTNRFCIYFNLILYFRCTIWRRQRYWAKCLI